jgi:hypothetical protein
VIRTVWDAPEAAEKAGDRHYEKKRFSKNSGRGRGGDILCPFAGGSGETA